MPKTPNKLDTKKLGAKKSHAVHRNGGEYKRYRECEQCPKTAIAGFITSFRAREETPSSLHRFSKVYA